MQQVRYMYLSFAVNHSINDITLSSVNVVNRREFLPVRSMRTGQNCIGFSQVISASNDVTQLQVTPQFLTIRQLACGCAMTSQIAPTRSTLETATRTCASLSFPLDTPFSRNRTLFLTIFSFSDSLICYVTHKFNEGEEMPLRHDATTSQVHLRDFYTKKTKILSVARVRH